MRASQIRPPAIVKFHVAWSTLFVALWLEKGNNLIKFSQNVLRKVICMYPNCVPDITMLVQVVLQVFCSQYCFTIRCQSQKRKMIQSNIYRILPKVHVIYTFNTICKQTIMIQVQAIQIFCSQGSIGLQSTSRKRDTTATSLTNRKKIYGSALILFMLSL